MTVRASAALAAVAAALLLAGSGGSARVATTVAATPPPATVPAPQTCDPAAVVPAPAGEQSLAAVARRALVAYRRPGGPAARRFQRLDRNGFPATFAVRALRRTDGCAPAWYRVELPVRPNGTEGWVRASAVTIWPLRTRIVIHVGARSLVLYRAGRVVLRTRVSTGAPDSPTPLGRFYVTERFAVSNPAGPWGPAALGTSAHSPVLRSWAQGGPIGIHGTNEPSSIGHASSHGCIRLPNGTMRRLFALTPAGTPILIRP